MVIKDERVRFFSSISKRYGRSRNCNNLDLIEHSAFVIETCSYPVIQVVTTAECSIKSRLLQILNHPSTSLTIVKPTCAQCKYSLRDENHNFVDSNRFLLMKLNKCRLGDHCG